jgi:hypothetical protein
MPEVVNRARRRSATALAIFAGLLLAWQVQATVGMAEWQTETPGGNRILHLDPLKERYGTCLIGGNGADGRPLESAQVHVARIRWWQYYRTYVVGETRRGFFLFDEISRSVDWYDSIEALRTHARQRSQGGPLSAPMTQPPASRR